MIGGADRSRLLGDLPAQHNKLRARRPFGSQAHRTALQRFANELAAVDRAKVDRRHKGADLRHDAQQAFLREVLEDFPHRRAADAVLFGDAHFREQLSGPQLSTQNVGIEPRMQTVALAPCSLEPRDRRNSSVGAHATSPSRRPKYTCIQVKAMSPSFPSITGPTDLFNSSDTAG